MQIFINFFYSVLYQPIFNALIALYQFLPGNDFGIAIIVLTLIIRTLFYPLMKKSIESQKRISDLQPKIQEIQQKYKDDKEKQARAMMELYQKEKFNPFGGCLPLLIQLPIMIALYRVLRDGTGPETMNALYSFIPNPGEINIYFLGLINLSISSYFMAVIAGVLQFFQSKMIMAKNLKNKSNPSSDTALQFSKIFQNQMLYFFPFFTVMILISLPSAIALYWIITAAFSIFQQYLVINQKKIKCL